MVSADSYKREAACGRWALRFFVDVPQELRRSEYHDKTCGIVDVRMPRGKGMSQVEFVDSHITTNEMGEQISSRATPPFKAVSMDPKLWGEACRH